MPRMNGYYLKIVPQSYILVGIIFFFICGCCPFVIDFDNLTQTTIAVIQTVTICAVIAFSFFMIWFGISVRVFIYDNCLVFRNMFFQYTTLTYNNIESFEHKVALNSVHIREYGGRKRKIDYASFKNAIYLVSFLAWRGISEYAAGPKKTDTEIEPYSDIEDIAARINKKWIRFIRSFIVSLIITTAIAIFWVEEKDVLKCGLSLAMFIFIETVNEIMFVKNKLVLTSDTAARFYCLRKPRTIRYEDIDYVEKHFSEGSRVSVSYIFYSKGREYFNVPYDYTNMHLALERLKRRGVALIRGDRFNYH